MPIILNDGRTFEPQKTVVEATPRPVGNPVVETDNLQTQQQAQQVKVEKDKPKHKFEAKSAYMSDMFTVHKL
jgi:hypothetical protein